MIEATALIEKATAALARLDAPSLQQLEMQARMLRVEGGEAAEVRARLRVFASVLRETDRGLRILERVRGEGDRWAR